MTLENVDKVVWIVSYPRSGTSWLRMIIANVLYPQETRGFRQTDIICPDLHSLGDVGFISLMRNYSFSVPLFIKSHYFYLPWYSNVIYLVRDPRDVVASEYYYDVWKNNRDIGFNGFVDRFISGDVSFGKWGDHVRFWFDQSVGVVGSVNRLLVRYEDLFENAVDVVSGIFRHFGLEKYSDAVSKAVSVVSYETMKKMAGSEGVHPFKLGMTGKPGGGRAIVSSDVEERIIQAFGHSMRLAGYLNGNN